MKKLFVVVLVGLLAGCTVGNADPVSAPTIATRSVDASMFTCVSPTDAVMEFVEANAATPDWPASKVSVVKVGSGNNASETWEVVAFQNNSSYVNSWLTNVDSQAQPSDVQWINLGFMNLSPGRSQLLVWDNVNWTGEKLAAGQQAQQKAFSCLV